MKKLKVLCLSTLSLLGGKLFAKDVSLYNGNEKMFRDQERVRVINVLQSMGIPYRVSANKNIMIPQSLVNDVKEIVAQGFQAQRKWPTDTTVEE